jgi:predicted porin
LTNIYILKSLKEIFLEITMKKQLITLAVASAVAAPMVAQADVKVYGILQAEYNIEDRSGDFCNLFTVHECASNQGIDDSAGRSRIGIKFSEKLGGGLTAFGKVEFRIDPSDNNSAGTKGDASDGGIDGSNQSVSGALGQRDSFVGLKGSWGSLAVGSFNAPYKTAGGVKWDPFAATHLQARRAGGMTGGAGIGGHNGFMRNTIYYKSPKISGFQAHIALAPDETNSGGSENYNDADNDWSIALHYKNGPWHAIGAYNKNNNPGGQDDETLGKLGLRWKSGNHTIAGQYEWVDNCDRACTGAAPGSESTFGGATQAAFGGYSRTEAGTDMELFWLNYQFKYGNNIFTASYGNTDGDSNLVGVSGNDTDYWMIGWIYKFSKKTRVFAGYSESDTNDSSGPGTSIVDRDVFSVGIRKDF